MTIKADETFTMAEFLKLASAELNSGQIAQFRVRLPCGCTTTYGVAAISDDMTNCTNAADDQSTKDAEAIKALGGRLN